MCESCQKTAKELEKAVLSLGHAPECVMDGARVRFRCSCGWESHVHSDNDMEGDPEKGPASLYREWARHARKILCKN